MRVGGDLKEETKSYSSPHLLPGRPVISQLCFFGTQEQASEDGHDDSEHTYKRLSVPISRRMGSRKGQLMTYSVSNT